LRQKSNKLEGPNKISVANLELARTIGPRHRFENSMSKLNLGNISLGYDEVGPPDSPQTVVLIHGFASNRLENWRRLGWLGAFERRRIRAIAFDLRGHGESGKPHDPAAYAEDELNSDLAGVIATLDARNVTLMGYSRGARVGLAAAMAAPERFPRLILGGVGDRMFETSSTRDEMAAAMETSDPGSIIDPLLKSFRQFADEQGEDREALAAFSRAARAPLEREGLSKIQAQALIVTGSHDDVAGPIDTLAACIPRAKSVVLPGCDHFSAIAHALFKAAVFDFLEETELGEFGR